MDITLLKNQLSQASASVQELAVLSCNSNYGLSIRALVCARELDRFIAELEATDEPR